MMELLSRWFIRDRDNVTDPRVRRAYGQLCGFVGRFEVIWKSYTAAAGLHIAQGAQLFTALGDELVFVLGGGGVVLFRHRCVGARLKKEGCTQPNR